MKALLCIFGFHKWVYPSMTEPILARRSLGNGKYGPEETFHRGDGNIPMYRDCLHCGKRQLETYGRWQ